MMQKRSRFIAFILLFQLVLTSLSAHAQTIFGGTEDPETGETVGLCLTNPAAPECAGVECGSPEFADDVKCMTEAQAGTGLVREELASTGITGTSDIGDLILKAINFSLPYLTLAAFVGFVAAGFFYVTAFGNDDNLEKAKKILIWSTVGIILVMFSFAIVQFLTSGFLGQL